MSVPSSSYHLTMRPLLSWKGGEGGGGGLKKKKGEGEGEKMLERNACVKGPLYSPHSAAQYFRMKEGRKKNSEKRKGGGREMLCCNRADAVRTLDYHGLGDRRRSLRREEKKGGGGKEDA